MKDTLIKIGILIAAFLPLLWLSWLSAAPSGERTVTWTPDVFSPFIPSPLPGERVSDVEYRENGDAYVSLVGEPTYVGVFPPSDSFTHATVTVEFDPHDAFAFELGGLTNVAAYAFDFRPLSNRVIESLSWSALVSSDEDLLVFAKEEVKATVQDFFSHLPSRSAVVTYRASLPGTYRDPAYVPLGRTQRFDVSLRGSHEYYTYVKNETFDVAVTYQDINRTYGADEGYIRVYNESGDIVLSSNVVDDENISEDQVYTTKTISLSQSDLPEGVYRVELSGTSDILWRTFVTRQRYMSFKNRLYIADDVGYLPQDRATTFVTNSKSLAIETFHATSAKALHLGEETIAVPVPHELIRATITEEGVIAGRIDRGDMKIVGEAKFALSRQAFFDPDPRALTPITDLGDDSLQYLVTSLPSASTTDEGWRSASATFDLARLAMEGGAYKFAFSLPGQVIDEESVDLHRISVTFHKDPISLSTAIGEELRRWYRALRDRVW